MKFKFLAKVLISMSLFSSLHANAVETNKTDDIVSQITQKNGVISFSSRVKNFGEVGRGEVLEHDFTFTNTGKGPLIIHGVHAACGCTAVEVDRGKAYQPGESGTIHVSFDTTDFSGKVTKTFTLLTNERVKRVRVLTIKARVKNSIAVNPPLVDFGEIKLGRGTQRQILLSSLDGKPFEIKEIRSSDNFSTTYKKAGKDWLVDIFAAEDIKPGQLRESIKIKTNHNKLKTIPVPMVAEVVGMLEHKPSYLEFGAVKPSKSVMKSFNVAGETKFKITGAKAKIFINGKEVDGEKLIKFAYDGDRKNGHNVSIALKNEQQYSGSVHGDLFFETDLPHHSKYKVEFYAFFQE